MSTLDKKEEVWGQVSLGNETKKFFVCGRAEWEGLSDEEQTQLTIDAMWQSGLVDVRAD